MKPIAKHAHARVNSSKALDKRHVECVRSAKILKLFRTYLAPDSTYTAQWFEAARRCPDVAREVVKNIPIATLLRFGNEFVLGGEVLREMWVASYSQLSNTQQKIWRNALTDETVLEAGPWLFSQGAQFQRRWCNTFAYCEPKTRKSRIENLSDEALLAASSLVCSGKAPWLEARWLRMFDAEGRVDDTADLTAKIFVRSKAMIESEGDVAQCWLSVFSNQSGERQNSVLRALSDRVVLDNEPFFLEAPQTCMHDRWIHALRAMPRRDADLHLHFLDDATVRKLSSLFLREGGALTARWCVAMEAEIRRFPAEVMHAHGGSILGCGEDFLRSKKSWIRDFWLNTAKNYHNDPRVKEALDGLSPVLIAELGTHILEIGEVGIAIYCNAVKHLTDAQWKHVRGKVRNDVVLKYGVYFLNSSSRLYARWLISMQESTIEESSRALCLPGVLQASLGLLASISFIVSKLPADSAQRTVLFSQLDNEFCLSRGAPLFNIPEFNDRWLQAYRQSPELLVERKIYREKHGRIFLLGTGLSIREIACIQTGIYRPRNEPQYNTRAARKRWLHSHLPVTFLRVPDLQIARANLFPEGLDAFKKMALDAWLSRFKIKFVGEAGFDAGGPMKNFLVEFLRACTAESYGYWSVSESDNHKIFIKPSGAMQLSEESLEHYLVMGRAFALAHRRDVPLPFGLPSCMLKHLRGEDLIFDDLRDVDLDTHTNLSRLRGLSADDLEAMDLNFTICVTSEGRTREHVLVSGGEAMVVTHDNLEHYLRAYAIHRLETQIRAPLNAFLLGFYELIPASLLQRFTWRQLGTLLCGSPTIDVDDWQANAVIQGGDANTPVVMWLWETVRNFNDADRHRFLEHVTATPNPPAAGFARLGKKFTITLVADGDRLPVAHTCFNRLDLPRYANKAIFDAKFVHFMAQDGAIRLV